MDEMTHKPILDPAQVPEDIHPLEIGIIGNYAISVNWSDGHNTGFFPYSTIRELAKKTEAGCGQGTCGCK